MNCPRCKASIGPLANPDGVVTCPGCGSRLMTRTAMLRSQGGPTPSGPAPAPRQNAVAGRSPRDLPPDATLPATPAQMLALTDHEAAGIDASPSSAPPATATPAAVAPHVTSVPPPSPTVVVSGRKAGSSSPDTLDLVLSELRAVRDLQERILDLLERSPAAAHASSDDDGQRCLRSASAAARASC